jgi:hypothetical protein
LDISRLAYQKTEWGSEGRAFKSHRPDHLLFRLFLTFLRESVVFHAHAVPELWDGCGWLYRT